MDWLWGKTGYSMLDYWTLSHAAFWFVYGSTIAATKLNRALFLAVGLSVAVSWELFERFAERRWPDVWQSPESWWNAFISDLLCVGLAALAYWGFDKWRTK